MKGRSMKGRHKQSTKRLRVFVTPGSPLRAPGGVYTLSGRPLSTPGDGSSFTQVPGELDDWVPEPESYLPEDEDFEDFEVSSGSDSLPDQDSILGDVPDWETGSPDLGLPEHFDDNADADGVSDPAEPFQEAPANDVPDLTERASTPVMAPTNPGLDIPYVGEKPPTAIPMRIASSGSVRWKK